MIVQKLNDLEGAMKEKDKEIQRLSDANMEEKAMKEKFKGFCRILATDNDPRRAELVEAMKVNEASANKKAADEFASMMAM